MNFEVCDYSRILSVLWKCICSSTSSYYRINKFKFCRENSVHRNSSFITFSKVHIHLQRVLKKRENRKWSRLHVGTAALSASSVAKSFDLWKKRRSAIKDVARSARGERGQGRGSASCPTVENLGSQSPLAAHWKFASCFIWARPTWFL